MARTGLRVIAITAALAGAPALATPPSGARLVPQSASDLDGRARAVPGGLPVLIFYEDKDAGSQNVRAREILGKFVDNRANRSKFEFLAIADVEKWDWWPAKKYVLDDVRAVAKKDATTVLLDWKGALRKSWGLQKGKSGILLIASDGRVLFAGEGTLSGAQIEEATARLRELGAVPVATGG